jgi:precorrin-6A/cobalt-precorrin-6A reductase
LVAPKEILVAENKRLLILGGTGEAAKLADLAVAQFAGRLDIIYSLAGRTKPARELKATVRIGGFGGKDGLATFIKDKCIDFLIDATHPFAEIISENAYDACQATDTPRLMLVRPPWNLPPSTKFLEAEDMAGALQLLSKFAKRVLVTTGQSNLDILANFQDTHFVVRVMEQPIEELAEGNITLLIGRPPYQLDDELALMAEHRIDALLTKQSGGEGTVAKITAAIRNRIPIAFLRRPLPEPGEAADSESKALLWLENQV